MRFGKLVQTIVIVLLAAGLGALGPPRPASADEAVFRVSGITVDATAATAAEAREAAIAQGHRRALDALMARLVLEADQDRLPQLSASKILELVRDFSVADERTSTVRYLAELTFRFNPDAVRDLFRVYGVRFTGTRSKPLVVLPVLETQTETGTETLLWEEANSWYLVWVQRSFEDELVPLIVPLGVLGDVAAIDAGRAVAGDAEALSEIAWRYAAEAALVVQASLTGDPEAGSASLDVSALRIGDTSELVFGIRLTQVEPGPLEDFLGVAIEELVGSLQADWKAENHLSYDQQRFMTVVVPIGDLNDWLEVKSRLGEVAAVVGLDLVYLSRQFARADISFIGDEDRLIRALEQRDLVLAPSALSGWELRLSSASLSDSMPLPTPVFEPEETAEEFGGSAADRPPSEQPTE